MALMTVFRHQFFDDNGDPLNGGKAYFYEAGTSTPKDTYTTSAGDTANANPVILNSRGEATIFTNGLYTIDLKTSADAQVTGYPVDNVGAGSSNNDAALRWGGTSTGSANAQVLSPTTSITAYAIGQSFVWKAGYTNTGAATIAISGLSAIAMQKQGAALDANDVLVGKFYTLVLDTLTTAQLMVSNANLAVLATTATTATNQSGGTVAATTISASGLITATGGQIKFPATQNASSDVNTLDDYEEGTLTPTITFSTPGDLSVAYAVQIGSYTKIGRVVHCTFLIVTSSFTHTTASGNCRISGLPFTTTGNSAGAFMAVAFSGITKANYTQIMANLNTSGASYFELSACGSGVALSNVTSSNMPTGGAVILEGMLTYFL